ncbi:MAG: Asp-tRNA(Asn)/Glu-tRNA(Gln) amidotransferase subunit GatC [bacterium]
MKEITKEQVRELAVLARLGLTEQEVASLAKEMTAFLDYFQTLEEVDTEKVIPTSQVSDLKNVLREDVRRVSKITLNDKLQNAPSREKDFIRVKKVLE